MGGIFSGVLTKLAAAGVASGVKRLLEEPAVSQAISGAVEATASEFAGIEGVNKYLRIWCASAEFVALLKRMESGQRRPPARSVINAFMRSTGFYMEERTEEVARRILETFVRKLEEELYKSQEGLYLLGARREQLHLRTRKMVGSLLKSGDREDRGFARTRRRLARKVTENYRRFAVIRRTGGSLYLYQVMTKNLEKARKLSGRSVQTIDTTCQVLAKDVLDRLQGMARNLDHVFEEVEELRLSYGYALNLRNSRDLGRMLEELEALIAIVPKQLELRYVEMKRRAKVPRAIADLREFINRVEALDFAFRILIKGLTGRSFETEEYFMSEEGLRDHLDWYRGYHEVLERLWGKISGRSDLPEDTW